MPDDADPPRKYYDFKPTEFSRENPPAEPSGATATPHPPAGAPAPGGALDPSRPVDVRELFRQAETPGPILNAGRASAPNEVHGILADSVAREQAAGLHTVPEKPRRPSRRKRDYWVLMIGGNALFSFLAWHGLRSGNVVLFVSSMAAIGLISASLTWVMWFVMDDY
ncbi:hypothetical protein [Opitutus sp. ER46]|uniref:hypothetical protein n=1 Tax=Opitutus sp. ER46 TaxID=2161864 RepID=UPI000D301574|nr:hypothetical protein [Opitutus sp. ER46]PTX95576.1 hypothetical protein DB354_09155 [Opitutus sp. ER46]